MRSEHLQKQRNPPNQRILNLPLLFIRFGWWLDSNEWEDWRLDQHMLQLVFFISFECQSLCNRITTTSHTQQQHLQSYAELYGPNNVPMATKHVAVYMRFDFCGRLFFCQGDSCLVHVQRIIQIPQWSFRSVVTSVDLGGGGVVVIAGCVWWKQNCWLG